MDSTSTRPVVRRLAAIAKAELLKRPPSHTIARHRARLFSDHPDFVQQIETHLYPGLRKAGIPEE